MASTSGVPVAVSRKHIIYSEILRVTSMMRKNSRWASSTQWYSARDSALASSLGLRRAGNSTDQENDGEKREVDLMVGFLELKREVREIPNIADLPLTTLLGPFFAIIKSPLSTGPITSSSLTSIQSFFTAGFITPNSIGLVPALSDLSTTVAHCKFEASDASGDEVVLYRIMQVIQSCMCSDVGNVLGDIEVCEMLETVLTTCCQMRLSEILRRSAESTMHSLVRRVFHRLHELDPAKEELKLQSTDEKMEIVPISQNPESQAPSLESNSEGPQLNEDPVSALGTPAKTEEVVNQMEEKSEYGLPSILELLRVLINILDPNDRLHTDSTRLTSLGILNAALDVSGPRIAEYPSLANLIQDHGCKHLFQLARSDNAYVLYSSLRVISTILDSLRGSLKLQRELFFAFTIDRLLPTVASKAQVALVQKKSLLGSPRPGTPNSSPATPSLASEKSEDATTPTKPPVLPARGEVRELMLETLSDIARHPSFMVGLYSNYDCDVNCEDLFDKLIDFLTKGIYSVASVADRQPQQQASQLLCLDLLLEFIQHMTNRAEGHSETWPSAFTPTDELLQSKSRKRLVITGALLFNAKPKTGIAFLEEHKLIYADVGEKITPAKSLAVFLKGCTRLDKRLLGDFISKPDNIEVLKAFISLFDFRDKPVSEAMRELLEAFRLPGEAQQIDRIAQAFAECYFRSEPAEIKSQDAVYVLAFSVIMLNTDLYNPQNRKRMTVEDYQRNLRGVNEGTDFSPEYLKAIYDSIKKQEIVMPEEHTGQLGFEYAWKELLARSKLSGPFMSCNTPSFDRAMFTSVWKSVVSAIAYAFTTIDDDYTVQRAIAGFRQCATLAGHFRLPEVFDYVVVSLSQTTGLLPTSLITRVPNYPVVEVDEQEVTVSSLSVRFGTNFKGQLAAVVLFTIVNGNGNAIREGWTQIFEMFQNLFLHSLLPVRMLQMEDFLGGVTMIPLIAAQPNPKQNYRSDGGLLSALSSYLMTPYSSNNDTFVPEATEADVDNTLCTIDCITACRLDELYSQISQLDPEALLAAVRALEALAHEHTIVRAKQESEDVNPTYDTQNPSGSSRPLPYDPASVYLLETMISITIQSQQYIDELWPIAFEHLSALLSSPSSFSILLIERAVVGLLRLCRILVDKASLRDQLYVSLDLLGGLPSIIFQAVGEQVIAGLVIAFEGRLNVIRSPTEWQIFFALIRQAIVHPKAARQAFDLLMKLTTVDRDQHIALDNFAGVVGLLDAFAAAGGTVVDQKLYKGRMAQATPNPSQEQILERAVKAVEVLLNLKDVIPGMYEKSTVPTSQIWRQTMLPLLIAFSHQASNPRREIRHAALINLQRILLGPHSTVDDDYDAQVEAIFNRVIFTMHDALLDPQVLRRDPLGMPETRLRASALLCKAFMHFEVQERQRDVDIRVLWIQILDLLDRLMHLDKRDQLYEAIPESLKNVVLVMNTTDMLVPPVEGIARTERQRALWEATQDRIERFLPGFLAEVIPKPLPPPVSPTQKEAS